MKIFRNEKFLLRVFFFVFMCTAVFSTGTYHADEHFQIIEFANWKMGGVGADYLPWEFEEEMRPALQPAMVCLLWDALDALGIYTPFRLAAMLRIISALLSFYVALLFYKKLKSTFAEQGKETLLAFLCFGIWFVAFSAVRFSSENWSGQLFALAFLITVWSDEKVKQRNFLFAGLLIGLASVVRMQSVVLGGALVLWLLIFKRTYWSSIFLMVLGGSLAIGIGFVADRWFYGHWVFSVWNYFEQNIIMGKANSFGTDPWYRYIELIFNKAVPPISVIVIGAVILCIALKPKSAVTFCAGIFILAHMLIAHKEARFLFPLIPLFPMVFAECISTVRERLWLQKFFYGNIWRWIWRVSFALNILLLVTVMLRPAGGNEYVYRFFYHRSPPEGLNILLVGPTPMYGQWRQQFYIPNQNSFTRNELASEVSSVDEYDYVLVAWEQQKEFNKMFPHLRIVYRSLPDWLERFNFNNWYARTGPWKVYAPIE